MPKQDKRLDLQNALKPVEQASISFYGHELVAVRLEDGRIAAVLRWMCEGIGLDSHAQVQRINRKTALRNELVTVAVETAGDVQPMHALTLDGLPGWLYGIDENRVSEESREGVVLFQQKATKVLAEHFAKPLDAIAHPDTLVPSEPITEPLRPAREADALTWADYYEQMAAWLRWKADLEQWRESTNQRLNSLELSRESDQELLRMIPEILDRLGPDTLSSEHQATVQALVNRLHELTDYSHGRIYGDLRQSFHVGGYQDIPEAQWPDVSKWFQQRIAAAEKRR